MHVAEPGDAQLWVGQVGSEMNPAQGVADQVVRRLDVGEAQEEVKDLLGADQAVVTRRGARGERRPDRGGGMRSVQKEIERETVLGMECWQHKESPTHQRRWTIPEMSTCGAPGSPVRATAARRATRHRTKSVRSPRRSEIRKAGPLALPRRPAHQTGRLTAPYV